MKSQSLVKRLYELFVARDDVYGVETSEGWRTERGKIVPEDFEKHFVGEFTIGIYPFTKKGLVKWILADLDYKGGELVYEYLCRKFCKENVILEDTGGKGTHIWVFLQPTPLWQITHKINEMEKELGVRIFPKQREWRESMIGNFVRLPLGLHHKTAKFSKIIKGDIWTVKPYVTCQYRVYDQYGDGNCTYYDSAIGYCQQNLCPKLLREENV
jgi:hypothetical protein